MRNEAAECLAQEAAEPNSLGFCPCAGGAYGVGAVARGSLAIMQFVRIAYIMVEANTKSQCASWFVLRQTSLSSLRQWT